MGEGERLSIHRIDCLYHCLLTKNLWQTIVFEYWPIRIIYFVIAGSKVLSGTIISNTAIFSKSDGISGSKSS